MVYPSLATLIIVGDVAPQEIEARIKRILFLHCPNVRQMISGLIRWNMRKGIHLSEIRDSLQTKTKVELMIPHPCVVERTLGDAVRKKYGKITCTCYFLPFQW